MANYGDMNEGNEDRISQLTDDVLCCILSYLTTKEVVATSVLSKRWKDVWATVPDLTLELGRYRSLSYHIFRFFNCRTLVKLKITGGFLGDIPASAACASFPCLKKLSLQRVQYRSDISAQKLFSICHVLEDLNICRYDRDGLRDLFISVPSLKRLAITSSLPGDNILEVKIDCPRIQSVEFHGEFEMELIGSLSSLVEAQIDGKCGLNIFRKISHVERLVLSDNAISGLSMLESENSMPIFNKLVKLELCGDCNFWVFLPTLLERSPNLEILLILPEGFVVPKHPWYGHPGFYWHTPNFVPQCLITHLKKIIVNDFIGMPSEFEFLEYMLKFGKVLETVEILCYSFDDKWAMMKLDEGLKDLKSFEKACSSCKVVIRFPGLC